MTREKSLVEAEFVETFSELAEVAESIGNFWLNYSYMVNTCKLQIVHGTLPQHTISDMEERQKSYELLKMRQGELALKAFRLFKELAG